MMLTIGSDSDREKVNSFQKERIDEVSENIREKYS